ncbi:MAG: SusD/RagB family nutrient-binding outer membrane lipoprotein [Weeksellaceae bacterium]
MKKYILTLGLVFGLIGCSDDYYESINIDQTNPSEVPADFLIPYATTSLFHQMYNQNVNLNVFRFFAQYLTTTQYPDEPNYELNVRNITGNHWNRLYTRVLYNLKDARQKIDADLQMDAAVKNNQLAVIDIMEVYAWQVLVDSFGNIPYTEALQGLENQFPIYDDAATIYADLIERISADINAINVDAEGFGSADLVYEGDMNKWKKMAASLKLRIGVTLLDVNPSLATSTIQSALSAGVFTSNDDNFQLNYLPSQPYTNPVYEDLVISGRNDYVPANTVVDIMNGLDDPRRPIYFSNPIEGAYVGGVYGTTNAFNARSHEGEIFYTPTMPGVLLDYAEVEFMLAEAALKGVSVGGSVESHYNAGIMANMEFWGVPTDEANAYLASPSVAWGSAPGTDSQKLAMQFWLGMYDKGWSGWNVWRRFDYPEMNTAFDSGRPVPTRYTYPLSESSLNPDAYNAAASAIGGDEQTTKLFWDTH